MKIEAEHGELILRNKKTNAMAIIPARHKYEILDMIESGCDNCLNDYINKLPKSTDKAKDGVMVKPRAKGVTTFYEDTKESSPVESKYKEPSNEELRRSGIFHQKSIERQLAADGIVVEEEPDNPPSPFERIAKGYSENLMKQYQDLNWIQRAQNPELNKGKEIYVDGDPNPRTHYTQYVEADGKYYVYPTIVEQEGKLVDMGDKSWDYARETQTAIPFDNEEAAKYFSEQGYKQRLNEYYQQTNTKE